MRKLIFQGCLLASLFFLISCQCEREPQLLTIQGKTMGTTYKIKYVALEDEFRDLKQSIKLVLEEVNASMSTYKSDSEISKFNKLRSDQWVALSNDMFEVTKAAKEVYHMSSGWFDPTVGPLVNLWGFGPDGPQKKPSEKKLVEIKSYVGFDKVQVDLVKKMIRKTEPFTYLDYSAVAKGYGVDRLARVLDDFEISSYLVEVGGEIKVKGEKPGKQPWKIGIEAPDPNQRKVQKVVYLKDVSMATSGDYRNFFEEEGQIYSHTINPKTGKPVKHSLGGVSVFHKSCMMADAWATALMSMGPEKGYQAAEKNGIQAYFLYRKDGAVIAKWTSGVESFFSAK